MINNNIIQIQYLNIKAAIRINTNIVDSCSIIYKLPFFIPTQCQTVYIHLMALYSHVPLYNHYHYHHNVFLLYDIFQVDTMRNQYNIYNHPQYRVFRYPHTRYIMLYDHAIENTLFQSFSTPPIYSSFGSIILCVLLEYLSIILYIGLFSFNTTIFL